MMNDKIKAYFENTAENHMKHCEAQIKQCRQYIERLLAAADDPCMSMTTRLHELQQYAQVVRDMALETEQELVKAETINEMLKNI